MKRLFLAAVSCVCLLLTLCGCSLFQKTYSYSEDYASTDAYILTSGTEVLSSSQLHEIILSMVASGREKKDLSFLSYSGSVNEDLAQVCADIRYNTPLGVFALSDLTFETNRIVSYYIATVHASYSVEREKLYSIVNVSGTTPTQELLKSAFVNRDNEILANVRSLTIDESFIQQYLHSLYLSDSLSCIYEPTVSIKSYKGQSIDTIYDINLSYALSDSEIAEKADAINDYVDDILPEGYEDKTATPELLLQAARSLKEKLGTVEFNAGNSSPADVITGDNPDSRCAAILFRLICDRLGVECNVAEGYDSSLPGGTHAWNLVFINGSWYHADVSLLGEVYGRSFLISDETMWKYCLWDTSSYPVCSNEYVFEEPKPAQTINPEDEPGTKEADEATEAPVSETDAPEQS